MFREFVYKLPLNLLASFRGRNLAWHVFAMVLTALLVVTGFDWWFYTATRSEYFGWIIFAAGIGGFYVPVIAPVAIFVVGEIRKDRKMMDAGAMIAQSVIIASLIAAFYKALTGRYQPEFMNTIGSVDMSREFHFGFLQHGVFWGWPSSHAAVAFAGALVLAYLYRSNFVRISALLYALFVAFGAGVGFHWFSDVLAGAIIGGVIGVVVARSERTSVIAV